jgi:hypothetical protein
MARQDIYGNGFTLLGNVPVATALASLRDRHPCCNQFLLFMENRREFFKSVAAISVAGVAGITPNLSAAKISIPNGEESDDRSFWVASLSRTASPVLESLSRRELKKNMPVEAANSADRAKYTHLEAFGRLLAGIAPWLAAKNLGESESKLQQKFVDLTRASLDAATDSKSPDFMNFARGGQSLVDAAFLAQGILRAPAILWHSLDARAQGQVVQALKSSRAIATPTDSNWVMFAATVEAALHTMGESTFEDRLENSVQRMLGWYKGDGLYGDGKFFHFDYYNSFVIHPMLLDVLAVLKLKNDSFAATHATALQRARRYAAIQERLIAPDGTFPSIGRSTTYRFGAFHALAQIAAMRELPKPVKPAQVRSALTAVIRKMIQAPGTFDEHGWLRIGFFGHQPSLAEGYISTGSLYLCTMALLPLGLSPSDEFWSAPPARWTSQLIWSGESVPADHAIHDAG